MKYVLLAMLLGVTACKSPEPVAEDEDVSAAVADAAGDAVDAVGVPSGQTTAFPELQPDLCKPDKPIDLRGYEPGYQPLHSQPESTWAWVQDKNWYLLTVLQQDADSRQALVADAELAQVAADRDSRLRAAAVACDTDAACLRAHVAWTPDEITATAARVGAVLAQTAVVAKHLTPSGRFVRYAGETDAHLLEHATVDALGTLQAVFAGTEGARADLDTALADIAVAHPGKLLFFEPLLLAALDGLKHEGRDQAGRYEPLSSGHNQAALARLKTIDWSQWRFTVVLGLGWGPEDDQPLSQLGREHCDIVASRYLAGMAPFIMLSGGHVHPSDQTPYAEALEMKKYLMAQYGIPEHAILVDPHARHTTTNLRNVARQMMQYGIPLDRPALYSSDPAQAFYVLHLATRCQEDLGYVPYRTVQSLGDNDDCFLPATESLFYDARDERDP